MYTPYQLDKMRNFRYGMMALNTIEKSFKVNISKLDFENLSIEDTATIIWAGLVHEDKELTPERVMELIDEHSTLGEAVEMMGKAFNDAFGESKEKK